jgi:hypothetical protein
MGVLEMIPVSSQQGLQIWFERLGFFFCHSRELACATLSAANDLLAERQCME